MIRPPPRSALLPYTTLFRSSTCRAPQSPAAGTVAVPSLLVSPPTVSSLKEVNTTGVPESSCPYRVPGTRKPAEVFILKNVPSHGDESEHARDRLVVCVVAVE